MTSNVRANCHEYAVLQAWGTLMGNCVSDGVSPDRLNCVYRIIIINVGHLRQCNEMRICVFYLSRMMTLRRPSFCCNLLGRSSRAKICH